ncbi:MAG: hypothetical protein ABI884_10345 [Gemmatimonadota bacterium]
MLIKETDGTFSGWESLYVIVGSVGGALTGLQFVDIALLTESRKKRSHEQVDAFATPIIVHFCAVLLIGSMLGAPWESLASTAIACGVVGGTGRWARSRAPPLRCVVRRRGSLASPDLHRRSQNMGRGHLHLD